MKIRFIVSMGGVGVEYPALEKDKKSGAYIWHEFSDYEAVRFIDADMAVYENKAEYEKAKGNYSALETQKKAAIEISETLKNLDGLKVDFENKKEIYKNLGAEIKEMDAKIKAAEATIKTA